MSAGEIKQRIVYVLTRKNKADGDDTDIYVGSTSKPLNDRLCCHRCDAIRPGYENNRLYARMNAIGLGNWEILPLLSRTCDIKTIREVEKNWVRILGADLNTYSPITNKKEYNALYYINNKDALKEYHALYYKNNKEAISQQQAAYRKNNREKISQYIAAYYENNKETISQKQAARQENTRREKRFYCGTCGVACVSDHALKNILAP